MNGAARRAKGLNFERSLVRIFTELGIPDVRRSSTYMDDKKVDLEGIPHLNVQAKAMEHLGSSHTILSQMPKDTNINVVIHKKSRKGTVACMDLDDFLYLYKKAFNIKKKKGIRI